MTRALWFIIKLAIVVAVAVWLADRPGTVTIEWQGWLLETSVGMMILAGVVALVAAALIYRFWRAIVNAPSRFRRASRARKRERGYRALTQGMVAVAAGDATAAKRFARQADVLLNEPPLTMLLSAQAAQLTGDEEAARKYFNAMLERPETSFLGVRGLLTQALRGGDQVEALSLARKANTIQPRTPWVLTTLFDLESRNGDWNKAESTLLTAIQVGAVSAEHGHRHRTALLVEQSIEAESEGRNAAALALAQQAHDLVPDFAPAAARYGRLLVKAGKFKRAAKVVERAWRASPHPALAEAYAEILAGYDPLTKVKLFEKLQAGAPASVDGHVALAEAALAAGLWGEARNHLNKALDQQPSARIYHLLAELEREEHGNEDAARDWLAKAANAAPDPTWVCRECGGFSDHWRGLCNHCGSFDTLEWQVPAGALHLPHHVTPSAAAPMPVVIEAARPA